MGVVLPHQIEGLEHQLVAPGLVHLRADLRRQLVHLRVGVAAEVPGADLRGGRVEQVVENVVAVIGRGGPGVQVEAGVARQHLLEEQRPGLGLQVHLDVDARQHRGHGLADRLVVDVAVVGAVHRQLEAVLVAGLLHQRLGLVDIEGQALVEALVIAVDARRDQRAGRERAVAHDAAADRLDVDGVIEGLADAHVLERIGALDAAVEQLVARAVEAQEDDAAFRALQDVEVRHLLDARDVLRGHRVHHVDIAGQQRGDARGVVGDRREDRFLDVVGRLVPPVLVGGEHGLLVALALRQPERAGAVGAVGGGVLAALAHVGGRLGAVGLAPGGADDEPVGQLGKQDRIGLPGLDLDLVVADLADGGDALHARLDVGTVHLRALVAEQHVVGGEGRAVVEPDVLAQLEAPYGRAFERPFLGQRRLDLHGAVAAHQPLVDVREQADGGVFRRAVGVHGDRVTLECPLECLCIRIF